MLSVIGTELHIHLKRHEILFFYVLRCPLRSGISTAVSIILKII